MNILLSHLEVSTHLTYRAASIVYDKQANEVTLFLARRSQHAKGPPPKRQIPTKQDCQTTPAQELLEQRQVVK